MGPPRDVIAIAADALRGTGWTLTPASAQELARRRTGLVCPECGAWCERSDVPEDRDPWCLCGTLMEPGC